MSDLVNVSWFELVPRLLLFTVYKLKIANLGHLEPEDFVYKAIEKVLSGERVWNPEKVSIEKLMIGIISSDINHYLESYHNRKVVSLELYKDDQIPVSPDNPEVDYEIQDALDSIYNTLSKRNPALGRVFLFMNMGYKSREIAERMNVEVEKVYEYTRQVKTKLKQISKFFVDSNKNQRK